ncbi:MAG TPA: family 20 glycosylhydrolase [Bryobacteraceae bacterium]|nr:family 20 glycosylhydrolase [Bryobacteraceae bacterium]
MSPTAMRIAIKLLLLAGAATPPLLAAVPALMPMPVKVQTTPGRMAIDANFVVQTVGGANARLAPAVRAFLARVSRQTGILYAPAGGPLTPAAADPRRLVIDCAGGPDYPTLGEDESYTLDVSEGQARIQAATAEGAIHGLATFAQLIQPGPDGFQVSGVHIEDRPRFPWRGLMLDVCRHWMPVDVIKRNLDAMSAVKLNVLHWHLSEDQGFRVESKRYPRLQEMGSNGEYYTQDQVREIVAYARDRGIRVVPEFDVPGHSGSWFLGYPELSASPGPFTLGGRGSPSVMDPSKESTYTFLDGFIGEMAQLFPDPYYHIGGDEVSPRAWNQSDTIQAFAREHNLKDAPAIQVYFNQRLLKIVQKYGKTMVGWDEILVPGLPTDAVIQSWRGQKSLAEAASKGYRGILSWGYYLDHLSPASYHYGIDPLGGDAANLTPEQAARILGGEACMWAELVGPESVDSRIWPRTAAIAERLWSPKDVTNVDSMYARLDPVSRNLEFTGVMHRAYYQPMLDRIAGDQPVGPLRTLADAVEALGLGTGRTGRPTGTMPLNRFVDACLPESEVDRSMELAARRFVANPAADRDDEALLRRQFTAWAANDALFQPLAENNKLLAEVAPLSKELSSLGEAGIRLLDYLAPRAEPSEGGKKKLSGKARKAELAALRAAQAGKAEWLAQENAEIARLEKPPRRGNASGGPPTASADVRLAAYRPVKVLADALAAK